MARTRASLAAQAAALKAELQKTYPRVNTLRGLFEGIEYNVGRERIASEFMHLSGLMEQIVLLAHA